MRGVVHISDYNRDAVLQTIQDDILSFERKLRQLILLNGYTNKDMRNFFLYRKAEVTKEKDKTFYDIKIQNYERRLKEIESLGEFQLFEFSDILDFAGSRFSNTIHAINRYTLSGF